MPAAGCYSPTVTSSIYRRLLGDLGHPALGERLIFWGTSRSRAMAGSPPLTGLSRWLGIGIAGRSSRSSDADASTMARSPGSSVNS